MDKFTLQYVWLPSCVLVYNHVKKWKITASWPLFKQHELCQLIWMGEQCFTLYFHSCLISFLNSVRVEHRNFTMGGLGLCCCGLKITTIFLGYPLGEKTVPWRRGMGASRTLKMSSYSLQSDWSLTVCGQLCQPCGKMILVFIFFTWALSRTMHNLTR